MAIDKSLKQHYETQAGVKNFLGKQKMVKAPKYWLSKPGHVKAKLAYITDEEEQILIDKNLYGSLRGRPNKGPAGLPSLQGGDFGAGRSDSGSRNGGNGSHDRGGWQHHRAAAPKPAPKPTPKPSEPPGGGDKGMTYTKPKIDVGFQEALRKQKIEEDLKKELDKDFLFEGAKAKAPTTLIPKTVTYDRGVPFTDTPIKTTVGQTLFDPRTSQNALLDRGSGIGGILKGLGTAAASTFLPMLLPAKAAAAYKMYNTAKTASSLAKKFGITDKDVVQTLTSKVLDKDILKQTRKDDIPKVADRHPGTGKKKRTTPTDDRDGVNRIIPETLQSTVSEGTQQYLSDEMKEQYLVAQNKMKAALASGYYTDQDGRQIQLSDEQVNALTQWITKIDDLTRQTEQQVMGAADGGRVDKALGGRVRDI